MTPDELRKTLKHLKMKKSELARITGYNSRQITRWLSNETPIPPSVIIILTLFTFVQHIKDKGKI